MPRPTSKMSHDRGRRDSCGIRLLIPWFHSIHRTLAGGVTDVGVGSGALLGLAREADTKVATLATDGANSSDGFISLGLQDSMTSDARYRNLLDSRIALARPHATPNVKDEPRPRRA